jgi:hypothetical protein
MPESSLAGEVDRGKARLCVDADLPYGEEKITHKGAATGYRAIV